MPPNFFHLSIYSQYSQHLHAQQEQHQPKADAILESAKKDFANAAMQCLRQSNFQIETMVQRIRKPQLSASQIRMPPPSGPVPKVERCRIVPLTNDQVQPQPLDDILQLPPREILSAMPDVPNEEINAVAQRVSEFLTTAEKVDTGVGALAVVFNAFADDVLDHGDEAAHVHGVEAVAWKTEA